MSTPRRYTANTPVLVTFRWNFRLDLFRHELALRTYLKQLVARWSVECAVEVFAFAVRTNHVHMILSQGIEDHDVDRRAGIAPMMRNVLSQLGILANDAFSHEGRITQKTYHSVNLTNVEDLLQALSYIHHQDQHHGARLKHVCQDSRDVYYDLKVDGVVDALPLLKELAPGGTDEECIAALTKLLNEIAAAALALEERKRQAAAGKVKLKGPEVYQCDHPWRSGTLIALEDSPVELEDAEEEDGKAKSAKLNRLKPAKRRPYSKRHKRLREQLSRWRKPVFIREDRPPAKVGKVLEIRVTRAKASKG